MEGLAREMIKKLITATALVAGLILAPPVYAMSLDEDEKYAGDEGDCADNRETESGAVAIDLEAIQKIRDALTSEQRDGLMQEFIGICRDLATLNGETNRTVEDRLKGLLERGLPVHVFMKHPSGILSPLMLVVIHKYNVNILNMLIDYGSDINALVVYPDKSERSVLMLAVAHSNSKAIELLCKRKVAINGYTKERETALTFAVKRDDLVVVDMLLKYGADMNLCTKEGETMLLLAVKRDSHLMVDTFLKWGVSINEQDGKGLTPLFYACFFNRGEIVRKFIFAGSDATIGASDPLLIKQVLADAKVEDDQERHSLCPVDLDTLMANKGSEVEAVPLVLLEETALRRAIKAAHYVALYSQKMVHADYGMLDILPRPLWEIVGAYGLSDDRGEGDDVLNRFAVAYFDRQCALANGTKVAPAKNVAGFDVIVKNHRAMPVSSDIDLVEGRRGQKRRRESSGSDVDDRDDIAAMDEAN